MADNSKLTNTEVQIELAKIRAELDTVKSDIKPKHEKVLEAAEEKISAFLLRRRAKRELDAENSVERQRAIEARMIELNREFGTKI